MENIVITGGAGFIGSHLAGKLLENGNKVISVDNFELGKHENVQEYLDNPNFELVEMDVSKADEFSMLLQEKHVDRIYHLAANSDIQKSAIVPVVDFTNTFGTTYSVLEGMRRNGIKKLFFAIKYGYLYL